VVPVRKTQKSLFVCVGDSPKEMDEQTMGPHT